MATYKYIHWNDQVPSRDGKHFAHVRLLVGYTPLSIAAYQKMADELRKTFPEISDQELLCGQVRESAYCKNFTALSFNGWIEKKEYPGWDLGRNDYSL